jgi:hypothetical protein
MTRVRRILSILTLGLALVMLTGCPSKVTLDNYSKIQSGMSLAEVESILGKGTQESGGGAAIGGASISGKIMKWGGESKSITITFVNDQVVTKAQKGL